jgi:hypothetical protein
MGMPGGSLTSSDGTNWQSHTLGIEGWFYGVAFGQGKFVAVGGISRARYDSSPVIATSPDGVHWTSQKPNCYGYLHGITHGDDLFVAVGGYSIFDGNYRTVVVSPDGTHWTQSGSEYDNPLLRSLTYARETYVAVGRLGTTVHSNDGVHWESRYASLGGRLRAVTSGNGLAVAVGDLNWGGSSSLGRATILRSTDGLQWTWGASQIQVPLVGVAFGNGTFVAVGETTDNSTNYGVFLSSYDGLAWYQNLLLEGWSPSGVACGDGLFVAVGNQGTVLTSTNAFAWTRQRLPQSIIGLQTIAYSHGRFVATSFDNYILCSTNGTEWTVHPAPTDRWLARVAGGKGMFVIVAGDQTLTSTDGLSWDVNSVQDSVPEAGWLTGLGYANNQFFATDGFGLYASTDGVNWSPEHPFRGPWECRGYSPRSRNTSTRLSALVILA